VGGQRGHRLGVRTQLQAVLRRHPLVPPGPGRPGLVEHEYRRGGTLSYLAAMDVHDPARGLFGRIEPRISNQAFDALIEQVMTAHPYRDAHRVFVIVDNGTIHRGQTARDRLRARWPNLRLVHTPIHASWLNQIEIYFSILARKALTPDKLPGRRTDADVAWCRSKSPCDSVTQETVEPLIAARTTFVQRAAPAPREVAEQLNAPVSKTGTGGFLHRGFESLPLRFS
jgi:DDE superfamily endonuclease